MRIEEEQIDILLATYNGEKYIKQQIDSILNQTYKNIRLIISDDCSTDNTSKILKQYKEMDSRIELYIQEENLGSTSNFEFLLFKVESPFFMLSDQDDIWNVDKVEKEYLLLKEKNVDLVFSDLEVVDEKLNIINKSFNNQMKLTKKIKKTMNKPDMCYLYNVITGCTILAKSTILIFALPLPKGKKYIIHDSWIAVSTTQNCKVEYLEEPTSKYRQHEKNQIGIEKTSYKLKKFEDIRKLFIDVKLELFSTYVENIKIFDKETQKLNKKALEYYKKLEKVKYINLDNWYLFHKLYKNETSSYYILNFLILNFPIIGKIGFNLRRIIKK